MLCADAGDNFRMPNARSALLLTTMMMMMTKDIKYLRNHSLLLFNSRSIIHDIHEAEVGGRVLRCQLDEAFSRLCCVLFDENFHCRRLMSYRLNLWEIFATQKREFIAFAQNMFVKKKISESDQNQVSLKIWKTRVFHSIKWTFRMKFQIC